MVEERYLCVQSTLAAPMPVAVAGEAINTVAAVAGAGAALL